MSLWEKWEKEKLERMGIKVKRKSDVEIHDMRPKADFRKQAWIVGGAVLACFIVVYFVWILHEAYGGRWSDFPLVRILTDRIEQRASERGNP